MPSSLRWRLTAAFLFVSLLGLGVATVLLHTLTASEFDRLRAQQQTDEFERVAVAYYAENGTFAGFDAYLRGTENGQPGQDRSPGERTNLPPPAPRGRHLLVDADGIAQTNTTPFKIGDPVDENTIARGDPVEAAGVRIGTAVDMGDLPELDPRQQAFIQRTDQALFIATLVAGAVALLAGALLARGLAHPLSALTRALSGVGQNAGPMPVSVRARGEIGQLVAAFNRMTAELAHANHLRRQMTADIAHELRSPLAVISGYVEGMRDGSLPPSAERYDAIYEETQQLRRLIDDLRLLSLADAGELPLRLENANPSDLLADIQRSFAAKAQQAGVALTVEAAAGLPPVSVDRARMTQVLSNLLHNALRHTPPHGEIRLKAARDGAQVVLTVADSGRGIAPDKLPNLFQRFYRVEDDRDQDDGQTGIGLAIVKALTEMHGGSVRAESAGLGHGATFTVRLPVQL